jgi:methionine synthase II (cobalamin-independent)
MQQAVRHVVSEQLGAGIDIGNDGEQQREAFLCMFGIGCPASAASGNAGLARMSKGIPCSKLN